jgi:hypothetical protein
MALLIFSSHKKTAKINGVVVDKFCSIWYGMDHLYLHLHQLLLRRVELHAVIFTVFCSCTSRAKRVRSNVARNIKTRSARNSWEGSDTTWHQQVATTSHRPQSIKQHDRLRNTKNSLLAGRVDSVTFKSPLPSRRCLRCLSHRTQCHRAFKSRVTETSLVTVSHWHDSSSHNASALLEVSKASKWQWQDAVPCRRHAYTNDRHMCTYGNSHGKHRVQEPWYTALTT